MTGIMFVLAIISLNLSFIGGYLARICKHLESIKNSDGEEGDE
jgi:hypothetical protein